MMEKQLVPEEKQAHFIEVMEEVMMENPGNWKKHYHGTEEQLAIKRKYSFSDRCRYYFAQPKMQEAIKKLFRNLSEVEIPLSMLRQYMPQQYIKVRDGVLPLDAKELAEDCVVHLVEDYNYATKLNYVISDAFCG
jgi:D-tagatose-1,6-bisphosphate aldolase subunit GatZ/KbaZ